MLYIMICLYLLCCILWATFSFRIQKILYNDKNLLSVFLFNFLLFPFSLILACTFGVELIKDRMEIENAYREGRIQEFAKEWIKKLEKEVKK